jgi:signal transduction histidine kinase
MSSNVVALDLVVGVLASADATHADEFYGGLCEAVCRGASMRRAVIFRYDGAARRVRAVGSHALDLEPFAGKHFSVESAPITAQALRHDVVVEIEGDLRNDFPAEFAGLVSEPARLACAPMTAAGFGIGVILADRPLSDPPLDDVERDLLWTIGKTAALASVTLILATQGEKARALEQRIDLARNIHEQVVQRLFGVSMALDGDGDLPAEARSRCASETQAALTELRTALQRPLGRTPRSTGTTLVEEIARLAAAHPAMGIALEQTAEVPAALEPLAQSVLVEAVRNAQKHADPRRVDVRVSSSDGAFVLDVANDGVRARAATRPGMGLRLAALEALQFGGVVEFGRRELGTWQVRLVVPQDG